MFSNVPSGLEEVPSAQMIVAEACARVSPVVDEILTPVGVLSDETNGLDFASVLELLGDAYNKKLCLLRRAEEQALSSFRDTYCDYLRQKDAIHNDEEIVEPSNQNYNHCNVYETDNFNNHLEITNNNCSDDGIDQFFKASPTPYKEFGTKYPELFHHADETRELWQKKVTVQEPFQMTLRDEERRFRPKQKGSADSENKKIPVTFHGNPVPAHVHLPMYKLITEKSEKLRLDRIDTRKHKILAEVKPFHLSFENSHKVGILRRSQSLSNLSTKTASTDFRAAPFPQHIFKEPTKNEKIFFENLRKIRIKSRAEELLKMSSLPFTGEKILNRCNSFGNLNHENISKADQANRSQPVKPKGKSIITKSDINHNRSKNRHKNCIPNTEVLFKSTSGKEIYSSSEANKNFNYKLTKTAILRQEMCRQEQQKISRKAVQERADKFSRTSAQNQLQREVALKVKMNCHMPSTQEEIRAKLIANRKSQYNRLEEYSREIQEMKNRIKKRPLLIEQQVQQAARNIATKRLQAGIPLARWVVPCSRKNSHEVSSPHDEQSTPSNNSDTEQDYYLENEEFAIEEHSEAEMSQVSSKT